MSTPNQGNLPQPQGQQAYPYADDEIDLKELFLVLWAGKWLIGGITTFAAAIAVVVALSMPNIYTSSALLAPAESASGGMASLMKQYGGLASLAGISLPGGDEASKAQLGIEVLKSRRFVADFVNRYDLLVPLMAADSWNQATAGLEIDGDLYDIEAGVWVREVDLPFTPKPSDQEAFEVWQEIFSVSQDRETGFVTVSIEHLSPIVAQQWVTWLVQDINTAIRDQDIIEAERSIEYLNQQITTTSLADLQTMFFELIQSQTETIMLARVRPEYVFKTIDPAIVPEEKSKPKRALICVLGTLLGGMLAVLIVLIRHYAFGEKQSA
jgi:uncharacterized protein involved in exopolysaccharide biosynthesis